jgi:hypothetical protein
MSLEGESKQPLNYLPLQGIVLSAVLPFLPIHCPHHTDGDVLRVLPAQMPLLSLRVTRGLTAGVSIFWVIGMRSYSGVMV